MLRNVVLKFSDFGDFDITRTYLTRQEILSNFAEATAGGNGEYSGQNRLFLYLGPLPAAT